MSKIDSQGLRYKVQAFATVCAVLTMLGGCGAESSPDQRTPQPQPWQRSAVVAESVPPTLLGSGKLQVVQELFEFDLSKCRLDQHKFGASTFDFQFTGNGTTQAGLSFRIHGHRASGTDGKRAMLRQSIVVAVDTGEKPKQVPGSDLTIPAKPRILESTLYHTADGGWKRQSRSVAGDPALKVSGLELTGTTVFSGNVPGNIALKCTKG